MDRMAFREAVFTRDHHQCVFCHKPAIDAHHLLERRLWEDGGYHPDNGISVCADCHMMCEMTIYSVEEGRQAAGITNVIVPEHLYSDVVYDKWGNIVLPDGRRSPGELFSDASVRKVLRDGQVLDLFVPHMKYPRTYHLPWSYPTKDDRVLRDLSRFEGKQVVVTEKMDGENTTLYRDKIHARAIDGHAHPSQGWIRNFWGNISYHIPDGWRVCGENLYARHSLHYRSLPTFFMAFSVWEYDRCCSWDETLEWLALLDITPVPVLFEGVWDEAIIKACAGDEQHTEGYVVRIRDEFHYRDFREVVAKYVRADHVRTPERWDRRVVPNLLAPRS